MDIDLTPNICAELNVHDADDTEFFEQYFTLQVLAVKDVLQSSKSGQQRHRVILSDGAHYLQAMFTTQAYANLGDKPLARNSIVSVKTTCSAVQDKRLLVVSDINLLRQHEDRIGNPSNLNKSDGDTPIPDAKKGVASSSTAKTPAASNNASKPIQRNNNSNKRLTHPIEGLSPYGNSWTIKARCTNKSDIRTWSNSRGDGKLFSVTLMDETGEIRGTAFNTAVDELYPKFEEGKVYYVSKARVNLAKKMFQNVANDYELTFERTTEVEECLDTQDLPQVKFNFVKLSNLEEIPKDSVCDVIGVVKDAQPVTEFTTKAQRQNKKRELTLVDETNYSVRLTLWGKHAEQYAFENDTPVIAFKGVRVGDFGGRSLSMSSASVMAPNPELPEAFTLRGWFDSEGNNASFQAHRSAGGAGGGGSVFNRNEYKTILEVKEGELGMHDKVDFFSSRATVMHMTDRLWYPACAVCNKKVIEDGTGWRCEKCNKSLPEPCYRYVINMAVADWSGQAWYAGFNEAGEAIFNMPANELQKKQTQNEEDFNNIMHRAMAQTFNFACKAKQDSFNDSQRVRFSINRIQKLDYKEECNELLNLINSPWGRNVS